MIKLANLQKTKNCIRALDEVGIRRISQESLWTKLITYDRHAGDGGRMTAGEKVPNVHRRTVESILEAKGIYNEHCIIEVKFAN